MIRNCKMTSCDTIHEIESKLNLKRGSVWVFVKSGTQGWIRIDDCRLRGFAIFDNGVYLNSITSSQGSAFVYGDDVHLMQVFIPNASIGYINNIGNFVDISNMIGYQSVR